MGLGTSGFAHPKPRLPHQATHPLLAGADAREAQPTTLRAGHDQVTPSFVRAPEGNGYCEWFIRILKEMNLQWVHSFATD